MLVTCVWPTEGCGVIAAVLGISIVPGDDGLRWMTLEGGTVLAMVGWHGFGTAGRLAGWLGPVDGCWPELEGFSTMPLEGGTALAMVEWHGFGTTGRLAGWLGPKLEGFSTMPLEDGTALAMVGWHGFGAAGDWPDGRPNRGLQYDAARRRHSAGDGRVARVGRGRQIGRVARVRHGRRLAGWLGRNSRASVRCRPSRRWRWSGGTGSARPAAADGDE